MGTNAFGNAIVARARLLVLPVDPPAARLVVLARASRADTWWRAIRDIMGRIAPVAPILDIVCPGFVESIDEAASVRALAGNC